MCLYTHRNALSTHLPFNLPYAVSRKAIVQFWPFTSPKFGHELVHLSSLRYLTLSS